MSVPVPGSLTKPQEQKKYKYLFQFLKRGNATILALLFSCESSFKTLNIPIQYALY